MRDAARHWPSPTGGYDYAGRAADAGDVEGDDAEGDKETAIDLLLEHLCTLFYRHRWSLKHAFEYFDANSDGVLTCGRVLDGPQGALDDGPPELGREGRGSTILAIRDFLLLLRVELPRVGVAGRGCGTASCCPGCHPRPSRRWQSAGSR